MGIICKGRESQIASASKLQGWRARENVNCAHRQLVDARGGHPKKGRYLFSKSGGAQRFKEVESRAVSRPNRGFQQEYY
jgi:hypothetical protein